MPTGKFKSSEKGTAEWREEAMGVTGLDLTISELCIPGNLITSFLYKMIRSHTNS